MLAVTPYLTCAWLLEGHCPEMMSVDVLTLINRFYGPGVNEAKNVWFDVLCCGSDCSGSNCTAIQQSLFARTTIVVVTAGHRQLQIIMYALAAISHFITTSILDYLWGQCQRQRGVTRTPRVLLILRWPQSLIGIKCSTKFYRLGSFGMPKKKKFNFWEPCTIPPFKFKLTSIAFCRRNNKSFVPFFSPRLKIGLVICRSNLPAF